MYLPAYTACGYIYNEWLSALRNMVAEKHLIVADKRRISSWKATDDKI
jgi:hypothetical protein